MINLNWFKDLLKPGVEIEEIEKLEGFQGRAYGDIEMKAKVYRAKTGLWEDQGLIACRYQSPVRQVMGNLRIKITRGIRRWLLY